MTERTPIAPHLTRLVRVAFQDLDLYSPLERSDRDRETAAQKLADLETLLVDRLVAILPRDAPVEAAAVADLLGGTRREYLRLLRARVGDDLLDTSFAAASWGAETKDRGVNEDRTWEEHTARVVLDRLANDTPASTGSSDVYLGDAELSPLSCERLVLQFGPR